MKKNKSLIIILLIVVFGLIGLTLAYFTNTASVSNEFKSKEYGTRVTEKFTSPENWLPGSTEPKTLTVTNSGQVDEAVRVSYVETWTSKNGDNLSLTQNNNRAAIINWANISDWNPVTESDNKTYYYYNYKLAPGETTSTLLDSVTFNKDIVNSNNCVETKTETGKKVECTSDGAGYDGATYKLTFIVETVQYDKYDEAWNTNVNIANNSKPIRVIASEYLKNKANGKNVINYSTGNASEMYTFDQPETAQTTELTDFRYIGKQPKNFIKFNCKDDDLDDCEIWRIIGVFEVEDENGNLEERIKIVKNESIGEYSWDETGSNEWSTSTLNAILNNGEYLNSLSDNSKNMIGYTKYYLGGEDNSVNYKQTSNLYVWERGTKVSRNSTNWIGKIAMIYPSDFSYTYAKGVDDNCYNNIEDCSNGVPGNGWIFNSSSLWFISPWVSSNISFFLTGSGNIYCYADADDKRQIIPSLYLKHNVYITSGDGSINNPYILG